VRVLLVGMLADRLNPRLLCHARVMTGADAPRRWQRVAEVSRKVLGMRYRSMPYLYTQHFNAHTSGCPAARPLTFTFPADNATRNVSDQWMLGDALMVSPIIYQARRRAPPCKLSHAL